MTDNKLLYMLRGQEVNLREIDPGLHKVRICVGWEAPEENEGFPVDLDTSCFLLNRDNRVRRDTDFVFYNNLETDHGAVRHHGDELAGGAGDREMIDIDLDGLHFDVESVSFTVSIHNAEERQQNFGLIKNAYIRLLDIENNEELVRYDLTEGRPEDNAFVFGELRRTGASWSFKALGDGHNGGLYRVARDFNVNVAAP